jgi:hypothetical protein
MPLFLPEVTYTLEIIENNVNLKFKFGNSKVFIEQTSLVYHLISKYVHKIRHILKPKTLFSSKVAKKFDCF